MQNDAHELIVTARSLGMTVTDRAEVACRRVVSVDTTYTYSIKHTATFMGTIVN